VKPLKHRNQYEGSRNDREQIIGKQQTGRKEKRLGKMREPFFLGWMKSKSVYQTQFNFYDLPYCKLKNNIRLIKGELNYFKMIDALINLSVF
jgi:hypothetical protein